MCDAAWSTHRCQAAPTIRLVFMLRERSTSRRFLTKFFGPAKTKKMGLTKPIIELPHARRRGFHGYSHGGQHCHRHQPKRTTSQACTRTHATSMPGEDFSSLKRVLLGGDLKMNFQPYFTRRPTLRCLYQSGAPSSTPGRRAVPQLLSTLPVLASRSLTA